MSNLSAVPKFEPSGLDVIHENKLEIAMQNYLYCSSENRQKLWQIYTKLHSQRSQEMVAWLEAKQGLVNG